MRSLELGGSVEVSDRLVGSGAVVVRPNGMLDFRVQAGLSLLGVARLDGRLEGWVETPRRAFNVDRRRAGLRGGHLHAHGGRGVEHRHERVRHRRDRRGPRRPRGGLRGGGDAAGTGRAHRPPVAHPARPVGAAPPVHLEVEA